jgi:hypothetical protein
MGISAWSSEQSLKDLKFRCLTYFFTELSENISEAVGNNKAQYS